MDRLLGRAREHLAHRGGLHAHDLAQLVRRVIADPLADRGAHAVAAAGIATIIASGLVPGELGRAWAGERVGTRFVPQPVRHSSFKLWLKYAKPTRGKLTVDDGAARALRDAGTSLLPVGIVGVDGSFEAGDAVEVCDGRHGRIGKGISNYSAAELRQVMGMKSHQVREVLPRATDEAVHRDYFVLA